MGDGNNVPAPSAISPAGHHLTPPNVPNVCYRPNNIMVEGLPSASSSSDCYLYPPIPPDVTHIARRVRSGPRRDRRRLGGALSRRAKKWSCAGTLR